MFYKTGIDVTNDKQMFNFLKSHYTYPVRHYQSTIANNVKLYNLKLSGNSWVAYALLCDDDYFSINFMIDDWKQEHPGYDVFFSGRSGGHLVLTCKGTSCSSVLPESIDYWDTYEEYKRYCKDNWGSVKENRDELKETLRIVQDFDKLCDNLRDYCDELSQVDLPVTMMQEVIEQFNNNYESDLKLLNIKPLVCDDEGIADISEISISKSLLQAFKKASNKNDLGLNLVCELDYKVHYTL